MEQILLGIFLYLKSYGVEPVYSYDTHPIVVVTNSAEIKKVTQAEATGACLNGTIYIHEGYDLATPIGKCALLHEVVHYIQGHCPIPKDLLDREYKENQAYALQNQCLIDNGEKYRAANPFNAESTGGYSIPNKPPLDSCGGQKCPVVKEESADTIRKRFLATEQRDEKRKKRGFHSRFEDDDKPIEPSLRLY